MVGSVNILDSVQIHMYSNIFLIFGLLRKFSNFESQYVCR